MKIEIDTKSDDPGHIKKVIDLLQHVIGTQNAAAEQSSTGNIFEDSASEMGGFAAMFEDSNISSSDTEQTSQTLDSQSGSSPLDLLNSTSDDDDDDASVEFY